MKDAQILIVDDLPDWRITLESWLSDLGYRCTTASSVEEAIRIVNTRRITLAILDVRLDESSENDREGLDIFRSMTRGIAVILK